MIPHEAKMPPPFRAKTKSFLDASRRQWQFDAFAWLLRGCGGYPRFLDTEPVLPIAEHFPDRDLKGHALAAAVFRRVRDHYAVIQVVSGLILVALGALLFAGEFWRLRVYLNRLFEALGAG